MVTERLKLTHIQPTTVSSSSVLDLLDFCQAFTIVHRETPRLIREQLLDPEVRVEEAQVISLWHEITRHSNIPHVGLLIGQRINPMAKGLLASWISQCSTLREALIIFRQHISLMNPSEQWQLTTEGAMTKLTFSLAVDKAYPIAAIERSMSALVSWGRALTGERLLPECANFQFSAPDYLQEYKHVFGNNIHFNQSENSVLFKTQILDFPVTSANPLLKQLIEKKVQENLAVMNHGLSLNQKVSNLIARHLSSQQATAEHLSALLNMSRQTLYRKLKQENTDFKTLLNEVRKTQALVLLSSNDTNDFNISMELGFKDTSSFYKAFQRWYGMTPSSYLKKK